MVEIATVLRQFLYVVRVAHLRLFQLQARLNAMMLVRTVDAVECWHLNELAL